jgi:uncharacterized protein (DUF779 family)
MTIEYHIPQVRATDTARQAVLRLKSTHGSVMFVVSAGCCDGSAPMCFPDGEFLLGDGDVLVGNVEGCPVYLDQRHLAAWPHGDLVIDVQPGYADGMSLEAGHGQHFVTRYHSATSPAAARSGDLAITPIVTRTTLQALPATKRTEGPRAHKGV